MHRSLLADAPAVAPSQASHVGGAIDKAFGGEGCGLLAVLHLCTYSKLSTTPFSLLGSVFLWAVMCKVLEASMQTTRMQLTRWCYLACWAMPTH